MQVNMPRNLVSDASGATATGDGTALDSLIDDSEATEWTATGVPAGKAGDDPSGPGEACAADPAGAGERPRRARTEPLLGGERRFEVLACEAKGAVDCSQDSQFTLVYTIPADAFPAVARWPRSSRPSRSSGHEPGTIPWGRSRARFRIQKGWSM
jgi:extracellular elastinolytic metalloproteinase